MIAEGNFRAAAAEPGLAVTLLYRPEPRRVATLRRLLDVAVALCVLGLLLPVLATAALAIVVEDSGSPFYCQRRVGRFGRLFTMYKLRTMYRRTCRDARSPAGANDRRISRVGRILRRTSIDEIPQLWNVVRGEMTLVGPRPEMPFLVERYEPWQHLRHIVTPGVTGLWQTTCRSEVALDRPEATMLDLQYIQALSPINDLRILMSTFRAVISPRGAY